MQIMLRVSAPRFWSPVSAWLIVLTAIFVTEYGVMLILPSMIRDRSSAMLEAAIDSVTLVTVLSPIIWWTVVRPLQEVIRLRTQFLTDLFSRVEADRRQTAYELHDGVGQSISMLVSGLRSMQDEVHGTAAAERCQQLLDLSKRSLHDVKRLAMGLRPSLLDDLGLVPALERLTADVRANASVQIKLEMGDWPAVRLAPDTETAVFRIVQEALANIVQHASARNASVALHRNNNEISIEIQDDGQGIADHTLAARGLGLKGMRERATLVGGQFQFHSTPGQGSRIFVTIPLIH